MSEVTEPSTALATLSALCSPQANKTIFFDFMILSMPRVMAFLGTFCNPPKSGDASILVAISKVIKRVLELMVEPGSLNPMCPLRPIPSR